MDSTPGKQTKSSFQDEAASPFLLLVDDDEDQLFLFRALLERTGCSVITTDSAAEALQILNEVHIDVVVCDVMMPEIDGREFVTRIRRASDLVRLPVIAITAMTDIVEDELLKCGADLFCPKTETRNLLRQVGGILKTQEQNASLLAQIRKRFAN